MDRKQAGFTLIELLVTLLLGLALIIAFFNLYRIGLSLNTNASRQALARNIAYEEMKKYSQTQPAGWNAPFNCDPVLTDGADKPGYLYPSRSVASEGLPAPATVTVRTLAPYGCSDENGSMPIMVEATVQYGPNNIKAVYATYTKV
jgi:prepilin-type N-terminal cleavage/methylation domain-containing protein